MKESLVCAAAAAFLLIASKAAAQAPAIDHSPVTCAVADKFPRMEARFTPADGVAAARIVFQGDNLKEWYSVAMKPEGPVFFGVLPKPKKSLKSFRYYVEVTDKALGASRTTEYTTAVVDSAGACKGRVMAATLASASILIQGPAGAVALPVGFASTGVVAAGTAAGSGTAVGATGAGAGAGGGIGATALVIGGLAVAGGAVAVALPKGDSSSSDSSSTSGTSGSSKTIYGVSFPGFIDVSVCAGRQLIWSSHNVSADGSGNFNETWSVNEPNTVRVAGQVTPTTFQATLNCTNGARSGSISATGSGNSYSGSFSFGPSTGPVSVVKQ